MSWDTSVEGPIRRSTVDGVPVFWTPDHTRLIGTLMFRVGRADESLLQGGLTHLVEHLALFGLGGRQPYAFNGMVDGLHVAFQAMGTPDELVAFFGHVCGALRSLPLERIANETRVLRTEAAGRPPSIGGLMLRHRYGARGFGALSYPEFALARPDPSAVTSWAAERFTTGNAAAWFSGPIPPGLRFDLPDGQRRAAPEPRPITGLVLPAWAPGPGGGICISLVGTRAAWLFIPASIAAQRLGKILRYEKGLTYDVTPDYLVTSRDTAHTMIVATALDQHVAAVQDELLGVLRTLASAGPTQQELLEVAADFQRAYATSESIPGQLDTRAFNELIGFPSTSIDELTESIRSMSPATVAGVVSEGLETALLMLPGGVPCTSAFFRRHRIPYEGPVRGRHHASVRTPFPWSRNKVDLIVGDDGVSVTGSDETGFTILYSELEAAVERPDGGLDLHHGDGVTITVLESVWREGTRALGRIRSSIPPARRVPLAE